MGKLHLFLGVFATILSLILTIIVYLNPAIPHWVVMILILIAVLCFVIFWIPIVLRYQNPLEPISVIQSTIVLTLEDETGKLATYKKQQTSVANVDNVVSYIEHGLKADPQGGRIEEFKAFTRTTGSVFTENRFEVTEPEKKYQINFDPLPQKGVRFERRVECKFINSFVNPHEWFTCYCTRPIKVITITINFPERRLPKGEPKLFVLDQYSNFKIEVPGFNISSDRRQLVWMKKRPIKGAAYRIEWDW